MNVGKVSLTGDNFIGDACLKTKMGHTLVVICTFRVRFPVLIIYTKSRCLLNRPLPNTAKKDIPRQTYVGSDHINGGRD